MVRIILLMCSLMMLAACSSGGSGGSGGGNPTKPEPEPLTVNPGIDQVVKAGDRVTVVARVTVANAGEGSTLTAPNVTITSGSGNYEVTGSSTNPSDIVKLSWTRLEGPAFPIHRNSYASSDFWFTAPDVAAGESVVIVYKLTLTNAMRAHLATTKSPSTLLKTLPLAQVRPALALC